MLAQGINFFILFIILKKFAYKPILGILHKRRADIEKGIEFTKTAQADLENANETKEKTIKEAKNQALSIITEAETSANSSRAEILKEAKESRDSIVEKADLIIEENRSKMLQGVYKNSESFLRTTLEKVLGGLPESERDGQLIKKALEETRAEAK